MEPLVIAGIRLGATCAGIKYPDRRDLVVIEAVAGTRAAAVFTRNAFCAAPVTVARVHLTATQPRYLVINTGMLSTDMAAAMIVAAYRIKVAASG